MKEIKYKKCDECGKDTCCNAEPMEEETESQRNIRLGGNVEANTIRYKYFCRQCGEKIDKNLDKLCESCEEDEIIKEVEGII